MSESAEVTPLHDRPRPLRSLVASARRLTGRSMTRVGSMAKGWQEDAWEMYDLVGEQRFLASTLAGRMAQARFYVGTVGEDQTEDPVPVDDGSSAGAILDAMGSSASQRAQLITRLGINLFVAGDGWLVGIPRTMFPAALLVPQSVAVGPPPEAEEQVPLTEVDIADLEWRMLSVSEVTSNASGQVTLRLGESEAEKIETSPDDIFLIRVWRPHPRKWWEADSPTRSSLPVLRELVGLTMHISAQVDSRLAGAGLLIVPQSAQRALQVAAGLPEDDDTDQFTEALMEAMIKPITDRGNASALVPLVVTVPDEVTGNFNFITFAKPLDTEARNLRDEAIRRLALGQDAPPELLLGTGGMNHWGAWLVQEDVVTTHLEPPLALICDAITTQYLWPVLIDQGMDPDAAHKYVVWYDVSDLVIRPNHSDDAQTLHAAGVISDTALREATGFDESDAPQTSDLDPAIQHALEMVTREPRLAADPGIPNLVAQLKAVLEGGPVPVVPLPGGAGTGTGSPASPSSPSSPDSVPDGPPDTSDAPAEPSDDGIAASAVA